MRKRWQERFEEVLEFKISNKRLPVRNQKTTNTVINSLARWLEIQRKYKRIGKLDEKKIILLESIGIIWDKRKIDIEKWENSFQMLIKFREKNPDRWPSVVSKSNEDRALARWCHNNRMWEQGKLKRYGKYPKEREDKLDSIRFEWYPNTFNIWWQQKYKELKKYRVKYPNRLPPKSNKKLYNWVNNQMIGYRLGLLSEQRIKLLNKIDFEWNPRRK